jgi:hypothetical protein
MRFSIAVLYKSTAFHSTVLLFVAANFWSWLRHKIFPICCDQELSVGFPFPFYLLGLLLDVVTALTVAVLITWIVKLFRG